MGTYHLFEVWTEHRIVDLDRVWKGYVGHGYCSGWDGGDGY